MAVQVSNFPAGCRHVFIRMATVAGYGPNESGQGFGWIGCATILWRSPILVILLLDELHNSSDGCTDTQDTTFPHNTTLTII